MFRKYFLVPTLVAALFFFGAAFSLLMMDLFVHGGQFDRALHDRNVRRDNDLGHLERTLEEHQLAWTERSEELLRQAENAPTPEARADVERVLSREAERFEERRRDIERALDEEAREFEVRQQQIEERIAAWQRMRLWLYPAAFCGLIVVTTFVFGVAVIFDALVVMTVQAARKQEQQ